MITLVEKRELCSGCGACAAVCPHKAIRMERDGEGFRYPKISESLCVECRLCLNACPAHGTPEPREGAPAYFGFQSGEEEILRSSASGGAFSALAKLFWEQYPDGRVYGACLTPEGAVTHRWADSMEQLERLRDSKYVESAMDCHGEIVERLRQGKAVLFSGTPCQVHGLKTVAERLLAAPMRQRLLLVDIVCNGVGSPLAWERYRAELERSAGQSLCSYTFRDKRAPRGYAVSWRTQDGQESVEPLLQNRYWLMYQRGFISRPSCSACAYSNLKRVSDVTVGDFHNLPEDEPAFRVGDGVSVVIASTEKGKALCARLNELGTVKAFEEEAVLQPRLQTPTPKHPLRNLFLKDMGAMPFELFLKKYGAMIGERKTV